MRALFAGLLAATLVGCTSAPHPETPLTRRGVVQQDASASNAITKTKTAKPIKSKKVKAVANVRHTGTTTPSLAAVSKRADPVTDKAKAAIAAMLEEPASAEFYDLKRANKKLPHRTVDTICGYVKATDGGETRGMPFLFTVDDGEAYLVNGKSHVSETVYRHLCK